MPYLLRLKHEVFPPATLRDGKGLGAPMRRLYTHTGIVFDNPPAFALEDPTIDSLPLTAEEAAQWRKEETQAEKLEAEKSQQRKAEVRVKVAARMKLAEEKRLVAEQRAAQRSNEAKEPKKGRR